MKNICEIRTDENGCLWARLTWGLDIRLIGADRLTEPQDKAIKNFCARCFPDDLKRTSLKNPIWISPSKIHRPTKGDYPNDDYYYDADTGIVYSEREIFNGHHALRITPANPEKPQDPE